MRSYDGFEVQTDELGWEPGETKFIKPKMARRNKL